jgi:small subunit ribosomal protein S17
MEQTTIQRKTFTGTVVSDKMKDTVVVRVTRYVKHPKYKKYMKLSKRFKAHNPGNTVKEGDTVTIRSCRPISKQKNFEVVANA